MILFFIVDSASPYPTEKEATLWWDVNNRSRYAYVWRHHFSHHPSPQPLMYGTRTYGKYILQNKTQNMRTDNFGRAWSNLPFDHASTISWMTPYSLASPKLKFSIRVWLRRVGVGMGSIISSKLEAFKFI